MLSAGNDALLNFTPPDTSRILINVQGPTITSVTPPPAAIYMTGQTLDFVVHFSDVVNVDTSSGTPRLQLTIGTVTRPATYLRGTGTRDLTFRYTVASSDFDNDGITVAPVIDLNGGTIRDGNGREAGLSFVPPDTRDVLVNVVGPVITDIILPSDGTYLAGQTLDFQVRFDQSVMVNTSAGRPGLQVRIGNALRQAQYISGSGSNTLFFRYTVQPGEFDDDGIELISPLLLNGSTIKDSANNPALLRFTPPDTRGIRIGQPAPSVVSITPPAPGRYRAGQLLQFDFDFGQPVFVDTRGGTPQLQLTIGSTIRFANYISGSGTNVLRFRYVIQAGDRDEDGISVSSPILLNGGTIRNGAGSNASLFFTPPNTSSVLVDGLAPTIVQVSVPTAGTYLTGQHLDFAVRFSEPVYLGSSGGLPRLQLLIGSSMRFADYQSGSGSEVLTFRYTVQAGDLDTDGITLVSPIQSNGAVLRDLAQNDAVLTFTSPDTSGILVGLPNPSIVQVQPPTAGTYLAGQPLDFVIRFSKPVTVTGVPRLRLSVGSTMRFASYVSGSGSDTLLFRYFVAAGDLDTDGITLISPLDLNGGSIRDNDGHSALLDFNPPDTSGVRVDATGPSIVSVTVPANGTYHRGQNLDFRVSFNEPAFVTGTPRLSLTIGARTVFAEYVSGSSTATLLFRYTVQDGDRDADGITVSSPIDLNGGTIRSGSGSDANPAFAPPDTSQVLVDGVAPQVMAVAIPKPGTYRTGQVLSFAVQFSETVVVGTTASNRPYLRLRIGRLLRNAEYVAGSGTNTLLFRYQVQEGDLDRDGITLVATVLRPPGTFIRDAAGNDADTAFTSPDTSGIRVDAVAPTIVRVTPPAPGRYITGQALEIVVRFSEGVRLTGTARPYILLRVRQYPATCGNGGTAQCCDPALPLHRSDSGSRHQRDRNSFTDHSARRDIAPGCRRERRLAQLRATGCGQRAGKLSNQERWMSAGRGQEDQVVYSALRRT